VRETCVPRHQQIPGEAWFDLGGLATAFNLPAKLFERLRMKIAH